MPSCPPGPSCSPRKAGLVSRPDRPDAGQLAALRARIGRIGNDGRPRPAAKISGASLQAALKALTDDHPDAPATVPLGLPTLDRALPGGGLRRGGLHELLAADDAAAVGFAAYTLARLAGSDGTVMWCRLPPGRSGRQLYSPGLAAFGLDPARLLIVHAVTDADLFWAMEEGLRSGALTAVLGETAADRPVALRRLQLAAESHGTAALLLRPAHTPKTLATGAGPALTRWRIATAGGGAIAAAFSLAGAELENGRNDLPKPAGDPVRPRWRVGLLRCRSVGIASPGGTGDGQPEWLLDADDATGGFRVAADLSHGPAGPRRGEDGNALRLATAG